MRNQLNKAIFYLLGIILLSFLLIRLFNFTCNSTSKCQPIILSSYLPNKKGEKTFQFNFEAKNNRLDIEFKPVETEISAISGVNYNINFLAQNLTNHKIKIRPKYFVIPIEANKYLKRYECLCFKEHKIAAKDKILMPFRFKIDPAIEQDPYFIANNKITIGYELTNNDSFNQHH
jgi:cytochrome c oxidase assembly protein subunit 11